MKKTLETIDKSSIPVVKEKDIVAEILEKAAAEADMLDEILAVNAQLVKVVTEYLEDLRTYGAFVKSASQEKIKDSLRVNDFEERLDRKEREMDELKTRREKLTFKLKLHYADKADEENKRRQKIN